MKPARLKESPNSQRLNYTPIENKFQFHHDGFGGNYRAEVFCGGWRRSLLKARESESALEIYGRQEAPRALEFSLFGVLTPGRFALRPPVVKEYEEQGRHDEKRHDENDRQDEIIHCGQV
jgi:hypothetical protein